ncbi:hypothetical protein RI129_012677 [Pyrocoelia pectoralis]|uniref:YqaJ viral recombinase domain-containing protein n=1 Tax=Pyrocoelia pectoralis TaxID=417401 RepID=A0AAN7UYN4_9COLE
MATKYVLKLAEIVCFFGEDNKTFSKGENALESGHVENMDFDAELMLIRGNVHASMKNRVYKVECHHIAALLLFTHYNIAITDKHCTWRNTKTKSEQIITCNEMYPKKPYCAIDRKLTEVELEELCGQLNNFGSTIGFTWHLQKEPNESATLLVPDIADIICTEEYFSADNKGDYLCQKCAVSDSTVGQHKNEMWLHARKHRLTASNFGPVLSACLRNRFSDSLYRNLTAIQWDRTHESVAITNFTTTTSLNVLPTGLWLTQTGFLGDSPDGLVGEDCIIEVKCPYSHRNEDLREKLKGRYTF